jgi:hypothetical protein
VHPAELGEDMPAGELHEPESTQRTGSGGSPLKSTEA